MIPAASFQVSISCDVDCPDRAESRVERAVLTTLRAESVTPPAGVAVLLTTDERIQVLNRDYLGFDSATDVLSFPAGEPMPGMQDVASHLGDLIISVPLATRQAKWSGHGAGEELQLLAVHGTLHLLGYDHVDDEEKEKMWRAQRKVLAELQLEHVIPTESDHA